MASHRYSDSTSQVQQLKETLSNLRLSSSTETNPNPERIQEQLIFNPTQTLTTHPHWLQYAPSYTPPPPPPVWLPPSQLDPLYLTAAGQQNIWCPPMGSPVAWSAAAESQRQLRLHATENLQDLIRGMTRDRIETMFQDVLDRIHEMMTHPTANYVVQRLIEVADEDQKRRLVAVLAQRRFVLLRLCCNNHGTRVVQKLVENLKNRFHKHCFVLALRPDVLPMALNDNGRHVIVKCLRNFCDAENQPILTELSRHVLTMGQDKRGYHVLKECVSCHNWGPNLALILDRVAQTTLLLSHDPYGNYVVQYALEQNIPLLTSTILSRLSGSYACLSASKYGSNVVEKCLMVSNREQTVAIIEEMIHSPEISRLVADSYGNYVMQALLTTSKNLGLEIQHRELLALLRLHISELKISRHGKQLIKWVSSSR